VASVDEQLVAELVARVARGEVSLEEAEQAIRAAETDTAAGPLDVAHLVTLVRSSLDARAAATAVDALLDEAIDIALRRRS
jgi:hypothetical protein